MKGDFSRLFSTGDEYDLTYDYTTYDVSVLFGGDVNIVTELTKKSVDFGLF